MALLERKKPPKRTTVIGALRAIETMPLDDFLAGYQPRTPGEATAQAIWRMALLEGDSPTVKLRAIQTLLERLHGRVPEAPPDPETQAVPPEIHLFHHYAQAPLPGAAAVETEARVLDQEPDER